VVGGKETSMSLSVVIVSYNYGMFTAQAIDSVLSQTKMPDRILFVDDCSAEGDIGCEVAKCFGIDVIRRENNYGVLKNFQDILFNQVTTDRMIMLGADNWFRNDAIEKMGAEDADIVSTDYYTTGSGVKETGIAIHPKYVYENGYYIRKFPHYDSPDKIREKIRDKNFIHGSSLFNVALSRACGGYKIMDPNPGGRGLCEDWGNWIGMIAAGGRVRHIPEPLLYYRKHRFNWGGI
jgi:glycosyltransferase involved in cell wall biosynthesis